MVNFRGAERAEPVKQTRRASELGKIIMATCIRKKLEMEEQKNAREKKASRVTFTSLI